ncbi:MAG: AMP-binding protein [Propionicimonas sp.]|nr:AMP-binding protein [Propionicimonas sp.]
MNTADYLLELAADPAPAIVGPDGRHSYADLRAAVATLGEHLVSLELPPGSVVALLAANGFFWVAAYLAALARGFVVAPLPVTLPAAEVAARLSLLGTGALLVGRAQERAVARIPGLAVPVVAETALAAAPVAVAPPVPVPVDPDQDAVYVFTSGTTGRPRVVRTTHRNLQANTESILSYLRLDATDRMLVVLPFSYVFGASLLHTHLRAGASMVIQPNFVYPESIVERMVAEECTGFAGVPSTFHLLLRNSSFRTRQVPTLRTIQQAGGKLSSVLVRELVEAQPQARVFVMYGQTEATARLSHLPPEEVLTRTGSIGKGIPGVELRVVTQEGTTVQPGEVGEIRARGPNISPGYLADPEATAVKMPDGELRTGDLATVDADGYIYIVDRAEDFIKSWGFRVASQEVEAVAMELPDLISAAAVGVPDDAAGERVELVVVARPGSDLGAEAVLAHCRARLAKHMLAQTVHFTRRLPLNANGKVSKAELRSWCIEQAQQASGGGRDG